MDGHEKDYFEEEWDQEWEAAVKRVNQLLGGILKQVSAALDAGRDNLADELRARLQPQLGELSSAIELERELLGLQRRSSPYKGYQQAIDLVRRIAKPGLNLDVPFVREAEPYFVAICRVLTKARKSALKQPNE